MFVQYDDPSDGADPILLRAWSRYAVYDHNALRQQAHFLRLNRWVLILGVSGTALALAKIQIFGTEPGVHSAAFRVLHYLIIAVPISISILTAAGHYFNSGTKRIALRAAAEAIKREIFYYRTRTGVYAGTRTSNLASRSQLCNWLKTVDDQLMSGDVHETGLEPYRGPIPPKLHGNAGDDDGLGLLDGPQYLCFRLEDQLGYYRTRAFGLSVRLKRLRWAIYLIGGAGTFLAAVGADLWIALTTALSGALVTYLEYQALEETVIKYNRSAVELCHTRDWWEALSEDHRRDSGHVDRLVCRTERILENEFAEWVQTMHDVLAQLPTVDPQAEPGPASVDAAAGGNPTNAKTTGKTRDAPGSVRG